MEQLRKGGQQVEYRSHTTDLEVPADRDAGGDQRAVKPAADVAPGELRQAKQMEGPVNCSPSELSTYLQALAEGYLAISCSDTNASVQSRSIPIASASYQRGKQTVAFRGFPSLQMSRDSTATHGADTSTLSAGDSPAPTLAPPAQQNSGSTENQADSGERWPASFAKLDHDSSLWKTSQVSLFGDLTTCSVTWPEWGLMLNGECWERRTLISRPDATASGLWRPATSGDAVGRGYHGKLDGNYWPALPGQICQSLGLPVQCPQTSRVAPFFYEIIMGWPIDWTACEPLAMDKFRQWLDSHGRR